MKKYSYRDIWFLPLYFCFALVSAKYDSIKKILAGDKNNWNGVWMAPQHFT